MTAGRPAQATSGQRETCECGHRRGYHDAIGNCWHLDEAGDEDCGCNQYRLAAAPEPGGEPATGGELREQIARELRTRLLPGIPVEAPAGPGWLEQADSLLSLPAVARLLAAQAAVQRVRELADRWGSDEGTHWYYDNRHSHPNGIGWVGGYSDRWEEDADELRRALDGDGGR